MRKMIIIMLMAMCMPAYAHYGSDICKQSPYTCHKVKKGESWESLFPNARERDVVKRLNRMNVKLQTGNVIAIPKNLSNTTVMDISPFPHQGPTSKSGKIVVKKSELAWGAYDPSGRLVKWGPMSGGKNYCADVKRGCRTVTGEFTIYRRQGEGCRSSKYPRPNGGAKMPYCMHFHKGYALHGSYQVPGHHASHGCVRMFIEDAKWLNQNFIKVGSTRVHVKH